MVKGIHGTEECKRCGACCYYFFISEETGIPFSYKFSESPCQFMQYDSKTRTVSCSIHEDEIRPRQCRDWFCDKIMGNEPVRSRLVRFAEQMPELLGEEKTISQ